MAEKANSLLVERDGWLLFVKRWNGIIAFHVEFREVKKPAEWGVEVGTLVRTRFLKNLEQATNLLGIQENRKVVSPTFDINWSICQEMRGNYPFSVYVSWTWLAQNRSFRQQNSGYLPLTRDEVYTLHHIFRA